MICERYIASHNEIQVRQLNIDQQTTVDKFQKNFPFQTLRERQSYVLNEIATAFDSEYKYHIRSPYWIW